MSDRVTPAVSVWPYVLVSAMVKVLLGIAAYFYQAYVGRDLPIGSAFGTICAVSAGLTWYSYKVNRPMQRREMIRFASGTVLADLVLSLLLISGPILWVGESLTLQNIDLALGGNGTKLTPADILPLGFAILFATLTTFGIGLLFAWIMTRKLPWKTDVR